jgi:hypothetical protein
MGDAGPHLWHDLPSSRSSSPTLNSGVTSSPSSRSSSPTLTSGTGVALHACCCHWLTTADHSNVLPPPSPRVCRVAQGRGGGRDRRARPDRCVAAPPPLAALGAEDLPWARSTCPSSCWLAAVLAFKPCCPASSAGCV